MSLHSLKELNDGIADTISDMINSGYKIVPYTSDNKNEFMAKLSKDGFTVDIRSYTKDDKFICDYSYKDHDRFHSSKQCVYFHSYDNIYADNRNEALQAWYGTMLHSAK